MIKDTLTNLRAFAELLNEFPLTFLAIAAFVVVLFVVSRFTRSTNRNIMVQEGR